MLNQLVQQIQKLYQKFRVYKHISDPYWNEQLLKSEISPKDVSLDSQTRELFLKPLAIHLPKGKADFLVSRKALYQARTLKNDLGAKFYLNEQKELMVELKGLKTILENSQELEIIYDIYYIGLYNFVYAQPVVVLDIGMNVGLASLYFAQRPEVVAVLSYEPFKITYEQAQRNISHNPETASKIHTFDYGLGDQEQTLEIEFDYNIKGSIGIHGIDSQYKQTAGKNLAKEKLYIKPVHEVFEKILQDYPHTDLVLKMDCEGAEYGIIESLYEHDYLKYVKVIVMEWHKKGSEPLLKSLGSAGFTSFARLPHSNNVGFIQAVRC
jgi:FkbM family methyltransferase